MRTIDFSGLGTALITPFRNSGDIDWPNLEKLIEFQIENGVNYLVMAGTTGEGSTIEDDELYQLLKFTKEKVRGRIPIVSGTGGNNTRALVRKITKLNSLELAGYLVATPYYNKPTQDGLLLHYAEVSKAAGNIPVILYNIPSRTAVSLLPETIVKLAERHKNIIAIKEASGNVNISIDMYKKVSKVVPGFTFLSGEDATTLQLIETGYSGVISVVSNETPKQMKELVDAAIKGDFTKAKKIHSELSGLMEANFIETSPGPVKYAMKRLGFCDGSLRLPLSELKDTSKMEEVLKKIIQ